MNVYDEMNKLCQGIKETHEYKMLAEAKPKLAADKSADDMVKDFLKSKLPNTRARNLMMRKSRKCRTCTTCCS